MFGSAVQTCSLIPLQTKEGQRVDTGGCSRRRVKTSGEGVARVQRRNGVDATDQRVQVEVAPWRHQGIADGAVGATGVRDGAVDVLDAVAEVEDVIDRTH